MTLIEAFDLAKEYLHRDSGLPGSFHDYKLSKKMLHKLSLAVNRLSRANVEMTNKDVFLLVESWLMSNPTRGALIWDLAKENFTKHVPGD